MPIKFDDISKLLSSVKKWPSQIIWTLPLRNSVFSFVQSYEGKKVNVLGEMQACQLATAGTAIGWDWRGSNNNFVLRKRSPLMPAPIRVDINYFFFLSIFFQAFFILVLFCLAGLPRLISYVPGTGPQALFGDASLSICQKTSCEPESIEVIETSVFKALIFALLLPAKVGRVKLRYSEKAARIWKKSPTLFWRYLVV